MNNKYLYRFKTEEEFIKDLGEDWKSCVLGGWNNDMNEFLGKDFELITSKNKELYDRNKAYITYSYKHYCISWKIITLKNNNPTYLPKKLSYE
jgi:hypothetical protein